MSEADAELNKWESHRKSPTIIRTGSDTEWGGGGGGLVVGCETRFCSSSSCPSVAIATINIVDGFGS